MGIPGGRLERWERIADAMERTAEEVTKMAAKIKNNPSIVPKKQGMTGREEKRLIADDCLEAQVAGDDDSDDEVEDEGSQTEEEEDEDGYVVYGAVKAEEYVIPKGSAERWDRIAGKVEG